MVLSILGAAHLLILAPLAGLGECGDKRIAAHLFSENVSCYEMFHLEDHLK